MTTPASLGKSPPISNDVSLPSGLRELHLFAGAGGGILGGILLGHTCVCAVEIEPYCRQVLLQRQRDGILPKFPIWDDAGGAYNDIVGVSMRFPLREWGWGVGHVLAYLDKRGIQIPERTDCDRCFHQRIGEWWRLWANRPELWADAEAEELRMEATYRTPGRDSWPTALKDLRAEFEKGKVPKGADQPTLFRSTMQAGGCRVCSM